MRYFRLLGLGLFSVALGCGPARPPSLENFGMGSGEEQDSGGSGECIDVQLDGLANEFVEQWLDSGLVSEFELACGESAPAGELSLGWVAPESGEFVAGLEAEFPAALSLMSESCGAELGCSAGGADLLFDAVEGELYVFVAHSYEGGGAFVFRLNPLGIAGSCLAGELGPAPSFVTGNNQGGGQLFESECAGELGSPERNFSFVPQQTGLHLFDTFGSAFDTVLDLRAGVCESNTVLACNDDSDQDLTSQLDLWLEAGEPYILVVDGYSPQDVGDFVLNVQFVD